ncbi:MAG: hypothetical protein J0H17_22275 [Rhizobiales bacterium]|nr:hypothetical protein [Hyphomicrobiales bacterium]
MTDRSMIGWSLLIVASVIVLALIMDNRNSGRLDAQLLLGLLFLRNVGTGPITITEVTANNRQECKPKKSYSYAEQDRLEGKPAGQKAILQVGEVVSYAIPCAHLVRATVLTNVGSFEFMFD